MSLSANIGSLSCDMRGHIVRKSEEDAWGLQFSLAAHRIMEQCFVILDTPPCPGMTRRTNMRHRTLTALGMVIALMSASVVQAAPDDRGNRGHDQQHQQQRKQPQGNQQGQKQHAKQGHGQSQAARHSSGPKNWKRGDHVSRAYYNDKRYWVSDWKAHHLSRPPEGHRWLKVDGRYVLTAVATGVITSIILDH
ncbi:RcnB family protein [Cobetia sp. MC34]|uniref:RcnB family protein n=1 Tax=Cobetia sp. MC34 TaxID=2785080 RepID=UPI001BC8E27F|nr:RcnB family protein [Cobetia sp. MC34]